MTRYTTQMLMQIFNVIFPILAIVLVGYFYGRRHAPDMAAANQINIDLFVPALMFHVLSAKDFQLADYQSLALAGMLVVLGSGLITWPLARLMGFRTKTFVPPMMFSNAGNMGLPLALFAFGEQALPAAVVLFLVETGLHFSVGFKLMDPRTSLLQLLRIPLLLASFAGLAVSMSGVVVPALLALVVEMLGQVAIPLMLFALGVRMTAVDMRDWRIGLSGALLCPLSGILIVLAVEPLLALSDLQFNQLLVFAALPPAVLNYMVAERYGQEPDRVATIVLMGNLASLLVIPATLYFVL